MRGVQLPDWCWEYSHAHNHCLKLKAPEMESLTAKALPHSSIPIRHRLQLVYPPDKTTRSHCKPQLKRYRGLKFPRQSYLKYASTESPENDHPCPQHGSVAWCRGCGPQRHGRMLPSLCNNLLLLLLVAWLMLPIRCSPLLTFHQSLDHAQLRVVFSCCVNPVKSW